MVDVGVTDATFGAGSTDNFFEALYPWPERITAVGVTGLDTFAAAFPTVTAVQADGRELPFADDAFDLGFSNAVVEHVAGRAEQRRFVHELCRVSRARLRDDAEPLLPARGAHARPVRPLAAACAARSCAASARVRRRARAARPERARVTLSLPGADSEYRHDSDRRRPRMSLRRPVWALYVLIVGLAVHNLVMSQLWRAGVRGGALSGSPGGRTSCCWSRSGSWSGTRRRPAVRPVVRRRLARARIRRVRRPLRRAAAVLARRRRDAQGRALRGAPRPAAGRGVLPRPWPRPDVGGAPARLPRAACHGRVRRGVRALDVFLVPLSWWRHSQGWFSEQLGLTYRGLSGLPENFVYNEGGGVVFRRLTSTFLSPLATAYLLVVALLFVPLRGRRWGWPLAAAALRRAALDAHARRSARAPARAARSRAPAAEPVLRRPGRRRGGDLLRRSCRRTTTSARGRTSRRASSPTRSSTRTRRRSRATTRRARTRRRRASTCRASATGASTASIIRGASGSATPG